MLGETPVVAKIGARADLKMGQDLKISFKMENSHFFDPYTTLRIHEYSPDWEYHDPVVVEEQKEEETKKGKKLFKKNK